MKTKISALVGIWLLCAISLLSPQRIRTIAPIAEAAITVQQSDSILPTPMPTTPSDTVRQALAFVSEQQLIPIEQLEFGTEQSHYFQSLKRSYIYATVHYHPSADVYRVFTLMIDPVTRTIEKDVNALFEADATAYRAQYGKLEPALFEQLQNLDDDAILEVAIWATQSEEAASPSEIETEIVGRYPEAGKALVEKGVLWAVADEKLSVEIQIAYEKLRTETLIFRTKPLLEWLTSQGFSAEVMTGMPVIAVKLPKYAILTISEHSDVAEISLIGMEEMPASDIAIATDRVNAVWNRNITGNGSRVAIVERYNIDPTVTACLSVVATRSATPDPTGHKSKVAAIAACNDTSATNLDGVAFGAPILDAGTNGVDTDSRDAIVWATDPSSSTRAYVINHSAYLTVTASLVFIDKVYDYWVKQRKFTAAIAAGNVTTNVTSPGKAYNVIAVGNVEDQNTANWSDDAMRFSSSRDNPITGVEKPEVAAPGTAIQTIIGPDTGTSFSSPQVAGLAALLMHRDIDLRSMPTAVKSIIMASAVHNIEGNRDLSSVDGTGSIDANLADQIAQSEGGALACNSPCWWNIPTTDSSPSSGGNVDRHFNAVRGERIRVVIAWMSYADSPTSTSIDELKRNFDLHVITPVGTTLKSESLTNNFEILEFVAPATGQYTLRTVRNSVNDKGAESDGNLLGIAWTKQATYLPDVRNDGTWTSKIYVRNDGAEPRTMLVSYFNPDGTAPGYSEHSSVVNVQPNVSWSPTLPTGWSGSAVVDGSEDLSVIGTIQRSSGNASRGAYTALGSANISSKFYLPLAQRNANTASGLANTEIMIQNGSPMPINVDIQMIGASPYLNYTKNINIAAGGEYRYQLIHELPANLPNGWYGSAVVSVLTSGGKVAVIGNLFFGNDTFQSYNGFAQENTGTEFVVPLFTSRLTNGLSTPISVQNLSGGTIPVGQLQLSCIKDPASGAPNTLTLTNDVAIANNAAYYFNPVTNTAITANWFGACRVKTLNSAKIISFVQMRYVCSGCTNAAAYESILASDASKALYFPLIQKRMGDGSATAVTIQNLSTTNAASVLFAYTATCAGFSNSTVGPVSIAAGGSMIHNHRVIGSGDGLPDGWCGTLVVTSSDQPISGFNQITNINNPAGDTFMAHNAIAH